MMIEKRVLIENLKIWLILKFYSARKHVNKVKITYSDTVQYALPVKRLSRMCHILRT